jgi:drug/metabolite transporter (DMT)-like permease
VNRRSNIDTGATFALLGAIVFWALVPLFLRYFTRYVDGWVTNGVRYPFAALILLPWLLIERRRGRLPGGIWILALLPASMNLIAQIAWAWAPYYIAPGLMAFVVRLSALWAVIGSFLLIPRERVLLTSWRFWVGSGCVVGGFVWLTLAGHHPFSGAHVIGLVLVVVSSIFMAAYHVTVQIKLSHIDSRTAYGLIAVLTSVGVSIALIGAGEPTSLLSMPPHAFLLLLISGFIGLCAAHILFYIALKRLGVAIPSVANLFSAFVTAVLSRFLFGELLTVSQWSAGGILIVGCMLLTFAQLDLQRSIPVTEYRQPSETPRDLTS